MAGTKIMTLEDAITRVGKRFSRVRADDSLAFAKEKQYVLSLLKRTPGLRIATPDSIHDAMLQAGSMGLSLNPTVGHCYLIPRKARRRYDGESKADYDKVPAIAYASPSYRGLIHLSVSTGAVRFARAEVVYAQDKFIYRGPHHDVEYELKTAHSAQLEKNAVSVFAVCRTLEGDYLTEQMPRDTVLRIRRMSEIPNSIMWHQDKLWTEGWKKAVLRRLYKTMPTAPVALTNAVDALNRFEGVVDPANMQHQEQTGDSAPEAQVLIGSDQIAVLEARVKEVGANEELFLAYMKVSSYDQIRADEYSRAINALNAKARQAQQGGKNAG